MNRSFIALAFLAISPAVATAADLAKGKEIYDQRCVSCHGAIGAGDGPVAAGLPADQKPRNFQEAKFKFATDDAKMKDVISKGGQAHGLSMLMPPQPDLTDAQLTDLMAYVKSLKK